MGLEVDNLLGSVNSSPFGEGHKRKMFWTQSRDHSGPARMVVFLGEDCSGTI